MIKIEERDFAGWFDAALAAKDEKSRYQYYPEQALLSHSSEEQSSINLSINSIADVNDPTNVYGALVVMDDISDEKRMKSMMYRYMTQEVAEQLLESGDAELGGDLKDVSVLFSDIRSYTSLTEGMEAEEVVDMLNEYFEGMVDAIFRHKGTLDKYIGDAIMAVFGSPLPLQDHAWCSVQTAIEMRQGLAEFNKGRQAAGKQQIKIGIGIHSDSVVSGNIGSSKRMELTSIGDGVNVGSRLEGTTKQYGCDIIISENTYRLCADQVYTRYLDFITVKGKSEPIRIHELVGLRSEPIDPKMLKVIEHYERGREYYDNRKFTQAVFEFATILEIDPTNLAAQMHLGRCGEFLTNPPRKTGMVSGNSQKNSKYENGRNLDQKSGLHIIG